MERSAGGPRAHEFVLSNLSPSVAQKRLGLGVVLVLFVGFAFVAGPLSTVPPCQVEQARNGISSVRSMPE
jgi:hypothetical protein